MARQTELSGYQHLKAFFGFRSFLLLIAPCFRGLLRLVGKRWKWYSVCFFNTRFIVDPLRFGMFQRQYSAAPSSANVAKTIFAEHRWNPFFVLNQDMFYWSFDKLEKLITGLSGSYLHLSSIEQYFRLFWWWYIFFVFVLWFAQRALRRGLFSSSGRDGTWRWFNHA
jgi:hypothetical protein